MSKQESMHRDFIRIQNEFTNYYCKSADACEQGTFEFNAWVQDLGINTSKPYGQCLEAFQWAKHMISKYKEDAKHTYYKVLFAFPIESMNGNVYTEEEIMNSVKSVIGQSPSINHWEDTRKDFEAGGVVYVGAAYEDGACEAILKVPNGFICPLCDKGKPLTEWIDEKKIVNVSLEATCKDTGEGNICLGLEFKAPTLLTSDTLPGIPLARISPMEKFIPAILAREGAIKVPRKKKIEVKLFDEELPDEQGQCPEGMTWNSTSGKCEQGTDCPDGQHWNDAEGKCVPDITPDPEKVDAPIGVSPTPAEKKALMEAMTEDEIKTKIADLSSQLDALYGSEPEPVSSTDYSKIDVLQAELDGYKAALTTLIRANAVAPPVGEQQDCDDGMVWDAEAGQCVPDTGEAATPSAEKAGLELKISELELANLQKEQQFKSTEEQVLFLQTKVKQAIIDSMTLTAELKASENMVSKLETSVTKRDKTILDKERTISEKNTAIQRMADDHKEVLDKATERAEVTNESREQYKTQLEELRDHMEKLDTKYNAQLDINLAQTLKLTETNEKMADLVAEQGELKAQVKKAKRLSKVIISME